MERMNPDDDVCLCFHVPLRKIRVYLEREDPPVASLISECLGAGTGCGWCVPYLEREDPPVASLISECLGAGTGCGWCVPYLRELHAKHKAGETVDLTVDAEAYASGRKSYRTTGDRFSGEDASGP